VSLPAIPANVVDRRGGAGFIPIEDSDLTAFFGKPLRGRAADSGAGAGYRSDLSLESPHLPFLHGARLIEMALRC
jgi:hypothetical protein